MLSFLTALVQFLDVLFSRMRCRCMLHVSCRNSNAFLSTFFTSLYIIVNVVLYSSSQTNCSVSAIIFYVVNLCTHYRFLLLMTRTGGSMFSSAAVSRRTLSSRATMQGPQAPDADDSGPNEPKRARKDRGPNWTTHEVFILIQAKRNMHLQEIEVVDPRVLMVPEQRK